MKIRIFSVVILLIAGLTNGYSQIIRPFTNRYSNPSERGGIVFVANSIMGTQGVGTGNPGTGEPPPTGTSRNNTGAGVYIDADGPSATDRRLIDETIARARAHWPGAEQSIFDFLHNALTTDLGGIASDLVEAE